MAFVAFGRKSMIRQATQRSLLRPHHHILQAPLRTFTILDSATGLPAKQGLYDPALEKDACGVGLVAHVKGIPSRPVVEDACKIISNLTHRGAVGSDVDSGDGAGVMTGIPHEFFDSKLKDEFNVRLPGPGYYSTGIIFLHPRSDERKRSKLVFNKIAEECGLRVIGWRSVPRDNSLVGPTAKSREPAMEQVFVSWSRPGTQSERDLRRQSYKLQKKATNAIRGPKDNYFYICSLSTKTIVYKGQLTTRQLFPYFADLNDTNFISHFALVHGRFSTNTFPTWERAQPLRYLAHNGEINTLRGNRNWMRAREGVMKSKFFAQDELSSLYPVVEDGGSDSMAIDNVLEFMLQSSERSLAESMMLLVPEAWENDATMPATKKAFYEWASFLMEPWDGPANFTFSDGRYIGGVLDRNGLRPSRYYVTKDDRVIAASEVGVLDIPDSLIKEKGRLQPGRMFLIDTEKGVILSDSRLKEDVASKHPFQQWTKEESFSVETLAKKFKQNKPELNQDSSSVKLLHRMQQFGYSEEHVTMLLSPMAENGKEALGSMGNDVPLACLSDLPRIVPEYFKQHFAQVTNPPIDPFRETVVLSLRCTVGPEGNLLDTSSEQCKRLVLEQPILTIDQTQALKHINLVEPAWKSKVIDITFPRAQGQDGFTKCLDRVCEEASKAVSEGYQLIVLSDRQADEQRVPLSSLLATGAVHQKLVSTKQRLNIGLIVESGECREVHHHCLLVGFGADAICPYVAYEACWDLLRTGRLPSSLSEEKITKNYIKAVQIGMLKVMAKMGISTLQSYKGAQIFEAVGIADEVIEKCFTKTASKIGGIGFKILAEEALVRHDAAYAPVATAESFVDASGQLPNVGDYHWRASGEKHINDPAAIFNLQDAVRRSNRKAYYDFVNAQNEAIKNCTIRGLLDIKVGDNELLSSISDITSYKVPLEDVEPASEIVKRFVTGAMSYGSISLEAHTTLAKAMNRMYAKSNTGEGGEDPQRYSSKLPNGDSLRSAIKQVASGRFGVTASYLTNADELQIKMAQGAKPGEGGELPGHKVSGSIAQTRYSTPGVGLISPPPHHDIYSIEDLAQLIFDLKNSNPSARISVKLVSETGVGVIAAGVAKAHADHILVSGHDGGTGASSWTGIKHAGLPWEIGLAETHQTLVLNDLRGRVTVQTDGQLRTGRDVVIAALLGAEEFGFATAPLIALGCTMMRKCHLNTCPVGIATQDPQLRKRFAGEPEHVINYFFYIAEEIREYMAAMGFTKFDDMVGRSENLTVNKTGRSEKVRSLDLSGLLTPAHTLRPGAKTFKCDPQDHGLNDDSRLDKKLISMSRYSILDGGNTPSRISLAVSNVNRCVGTSLSHEITKKHGENGLLDDSISIKLRGHAGQSLGAFLAKGVTITLEGDANDYVGKGLSGGKVVIFPPKSVTETSTDRFAAEHNIIVGNTCLYGATSGSLYIRGKTAERFAVRNSGALAVCEGVGDHGCEYMTGGRVVVLGDTGRNFAAGMSGGIAYVFDQNHDFASKCNQETVALEKVTEEEETTWLRMAIVDHMNFTNSTVAASILDNWDASLTSFVKVFPHDYKRALLMQQLQNQTQPRVQSASGNNAVKPTPETILRVRQAAIKQNITMSAQIRSSSGFAGPVSKPPQSTQTTSFSSSSMLSLAYRVPPRRTFASDSGDDHVEILDKTHGFFMYARSKPSLRPTAERLQDWEEINAPVSAEEVRKQASRCMDCGVPFCQTNTGCPISNIIPEWNDLVHKNRWREAYLKLSQTNNFPEFTGRVCPAPCESACVLGINESPVSIKSIEVAIVDRAFQEGWIFPSPPVRRTGRRVAVIGSGPAGLAAADQLNKAGHTVTVYEREDRIGGLLTYGIPNMKLDKQTVQRRVDILAAEGITFQTNAHVGVNVDSEQILSDNDAVLLAVGATRPRDLPVTGRNAKGIHFAMDFLTPSTKRVISHWNKSTGEHTQRTVEQGELIATGKDVVVIGGGDTGVDCLATAMRQGAKSVVSFEINPKPYDKRPDHQPWPTYPRVMKTEYGHAEAQHIFGRDPRFFSIMTKQFLTSDGRVTGVRTCEVEWETDASTGQRKYKEKPNTIRDFPADLVLMAMGYEGPETTASAGFGVRQTVKRVLPTVANTFASPAHKVFVAGDCRRGQSLIVWAIREGRLAAREIDVFLSGYTSLPLNGGVVDVNKSFPQAAARP